MNRRDLFKGVAGAGAFVALNRQAADELACTQPANYFPPPPTGDLRNSPEGFDPLYALKRTLRQKAVEERERLQVKLQYKMEAVSDLHSISPAYKRYRIRQLAEEQNTIQERFYAYCRNL